jgi:hypothetical protein
MVLVLPKDPGYYHYAQRDPSPKLRQAFANKAAADPGGKKEYTPVQCNTTQHIDISDSAEIPGKMPESESIPERFLHGGKVPRHLLASKRPANSKPKNGKDVHHY